MEPEYDVEAQQQQLLQQQQQQQQQAAERLHHAHTQQQATGLFASQHAPSPHTPAPSSPDTGIQQQMAQLLVALGQRMTASQTRSEKTPDVPELSLSSANATAPAEIDLFERRLEMKFRINADRYATPASRVNYAFSRVSGHAAETLMSVLDELTDWSALVAHLRQLFGHPDPDHYYYQRFITLRQANRPFLDFLADFRFLAKKLPGDGMSPTLLKQQLRLAVSRELTEKLNAVDTRPLSFDQLVTECSRLSALLNTSTPRPAPRAAAPAKASTAAPASVPRITTTAPAVTVAPASAPAAVSDPMDLDNKRKLRREQGLCFYCGSGDHRVSACPTAPPRRTPARPKSTASPVRSASPASTLVNAPNPAPGSPVSDLSPSENGVSLA